jgi:hypothetical protein
MYVHDDYSSPLCTPVKANFQTINGNVVGGKTHGLRMKKQTQQGRNKATHVTGLPTTGLFGSCLNKQTIPMPSGC